MRNDPYKHFHPHEHLPAPAKPIPYSNIQKGTSARIPVAVKTPEGEPVDLSDYKIYFTIKRQPGDHVYDDSTALVKKEFMAQDPVGGTFYVLLKPRETYLHPGYYYFDFEVARGPHVFRLGTFQFQVIDGVTNRSVIDAEEATPSLIPEIGDGELEDEIIPEEELDIILVTKETATPTIVILTNFGQIPMVNESVVSVNGHNGEVVLTAEDIDVYTKEEIDEMFADVVHSVNEKKGDVKITLEELGGVNEEQVKKLAYKIALDLYRQIM